MTGRPGVTIVIVSFNVRDHLARCLQSLVNAPPAAPHEVVVVDNASGDGTIAMVRDRWPAVRAIALDRNVGFAAASNVGIRETRAGGSPLVLLLNSDTIVPSGSLDRLIDRLVRTPSAAAAGPRLVDTIGIREVSWGRMPTPSVELRQKLLVRLHQRGTGVARRIVHRRTERERFVDWVSGACLLVWRADAEAVGLLDERFFMYLEDVDFCAAHRARGRAILFTPAAEVVHLSGRSRATAPEMVEAAYRRAQVAFYAKHHPRWHAWLRLGTFEFAVSSTPETRRLRIAIDARKLHDFGIGTYIRNLIRQLARQDRTTEYVLLCRPDDCQALQALAENFRAVPDRSRPYSIREQISVPMDLRREAIDLFHAPHYVLPPLVQCRSVVTIHDCIHLMFPQYLPNRLAWGYARASMWAATHRSDRVLTVSEASKRDILRFFHIPPEKIDVIYNGIDERFWTPPPEEAVCRVRERYQLNDPFLLYAGNIKPHKNLERVIEAFDRLRKEGFADLKLMIIGDEISKYPALRRAVHRHHLHKHVRFFGFVPDDTLAVLYRLAGVFVFPSLYEGFGLPPLEAMASGTPVVTSNVSSLPEVAGDAAVLVDPRDPEAIAGAIRHGPDRQHASGGSPAARPRPRARVLLGSVGRARPGDLRGGAGAMNLRVALVHDWLTGMRGGERVLEGLCRLYPHAELFTLIHVQGSVSQTIEGRPIHTSFVQRLPRSARYYRHYLPLFPVAIEQFDLDRFDLVVSSSHCAAKAVVTTGRARHVCYCHSPMRYAWDQFDAYLARRGSAAPGRA